MAFNSLDDLIAGMASNGYRLPVNRGSISNALAGLEMSLWRGTGFPEQGAVPGAAAICNAATVGALPLAPRAGSQQRIIAGASFSGATAGHTLLIEDRLGHMGGLSGTIFTPTTQTVGLDIHAQIATNNLAERIGNANYSEIEWYLEWYTATGSTVVTPTAQVTYHDASTGSVNIWGAAGATTIPATVAASRRYKLAPTNGKFIRSVQTITLSASTTGAGSFGVTAVRRLCEFEILLGNSLSVRDWSVLTAPKIADDACVTLAQQCITTSTGTMTGGIIQAVA
jgi:hypothetical protein